MTVVAVVAVVTVVAVVACCVQCVRGTPAAILPRSSWTPSQLHSRRPVTPCVHRLADPAPTLWTLCGFPTEKPQSGLFRYSSDVHAVPADSLRALQVCRGSDNVASAGCVRSPRVVSLLAQNRHNPRTQSTTRGRHARNTPRHARNTPRPNHATPHHCITRHRTFTERQVRSWRTPHPGLRPRHRQGRAMPRRAADRPAPPSGQRRSEP